MQAVILAGGRGKRMEELTDDTPKPMLEILGKPILEYKLESLPEEIDEVIFVVNYLYEVIKDHFGEEFGGRKIRYAFQETRNGTGGALHSAKDILKDRFLVINGDDIYSKDDLSKMIREEWAILVKEVPDPENFGVVEVDSDNHLVSIIERPKNPRFNLANTGAYLIGKSFFDAELIPISETEFGLPQTLVALPGRNGIKVIEASLWIPINTRKDYEKAKSVLGQTS